MIWHSESLAAVLTELHTDRESGLSADTAADRLRDMGKNIVDKPSSRPFYRRIWDLLKQPAVLLLLAVSVVMLALAIYREFTSFRGGDWLTPLLVLILALLRCVLVAFREWRADRTLPSMKAVAAPIVHVRRGGVQATVSSAALVPGDIVELSAGELIPADCRLIESFELHCDESSLTGDALSVEKDAAARASTITPFGERRNMLYAGCAVLSGHATAVVTETGARTEAGKAALMRAEEKDAAEPIQSSLLKLGRALVTPVLIGALLTAVLALLVGEQGFLSALLLGAALAVAILPEELPALAPSVVTVAVRQMAAKGAVVSRPAVAEELGRAAVLCTDKTGSFTQNNMTLVRAFAAGRMVKLDRNRTPSDLHTLIQLTALCSGRLPTPTEQAVLDYARTHGSDPADLAASYPRLGEIPFDPQRRRMTAVHLVEGRNIVIVKGAPEDLLPLCGNVPEGVAEAEEFMSAESLRILAVAYKEIDDVPGNCYADDLEKDLSFLGLLGLLDPLHGDVKAAVAECHRAGIRPVLFTNESVLTACATARRAGLLTDREQAITGREIVLMSDEELVAVATRCCVYARVSSADKKRLVAAWQAMGLSVAVTGDGAEDVPALRQADVGCAMARSGADVAAATADLVLTNDRFSGLVAAVRAGRTTFINLRKTVGARLAHHVSLWLGMLLSLLFFKMPPLSPLSLLWVGVISSLILTPALGREPAGWDTMRHPPRRRGEGLFARTVFTLTLAGTLLAVLALIAQNAAGRTAAFAVLSLGQVVLFLIARSTAPLGRSAWFAAPLSWLALIGAAVLLALPLFVPTLGALCGLAALTADQWRIVGLLLLILLLTTEVYKWVRLIGRTSKGR